MRVPDFRDVELVLRLYELRRETEMRKARAFLAEWEPASVEDVKAVAADWKHPENAHFRQVMSYWGMVADFTTRGLLHPEMFAAHCGEALFLYAKFEPFLADLRAQVSPTFLANIEAAIGSHASVQEKLDAVRAMRQRFAASRSETKKR